jgi:hypothetical protein
MLRRVDERCLVLPFYHSSRHSTLFPYIVFRLPSIVSHLLRSEVRLDQVIILRVHLKRNWCCLRFSASLSLQFVSAASTLFFLVILAVWIHPCQCFDSHWCCLRSPASLFVQFVYVCYMLPVSGKWFFLFILAVWFHLLSMLWLTWMLSLLLCFSFSTVCFGKAIKQNRQHQRVMSAIHVSHTVHNTSDVCLCMHDTGTYVHSHVLSLLFFTTGWLLFLDRHSRTDNSNVWCHPFT